jgi:hypothetical protein
MSQAASTITGTTAMTASCQADNAEFGSWVTSLRIGQTVAHRHDPSTCHVSATMSRPLAVVSG